MPRIISHRARLAGDASPPAGNTLEAIELLIEKCPDAAVEIDVRLTASGQLVVAHDNLLQQFTDGEGLVNQISTEDLMKRRVKCGGAITSSAIPQLEQVLQLLKGRSKLYLELKYGPQDPAGLLEYVLELMAKHPRQNFTLCSFNHEELMRVPNHIPIAVGCNSVLINPLAYLNQFLQQGRSIAHTAWHPEIWNLTDTASAEVIDAGYEVNLYTVPPEFFDWAFSKSFGVVTDYPMLAAAFTNPKPDLSC